MDENSRENTYVRTSTTNCTFLLDLSLYLCTPHTRIQYKSVKTYPGISVPTQGPGGHCSRKEFSQSPRAWPSLPQKDAAIFSCLFPTSPTCSCKAETSEAVLASFTHLKKICLCEQLETVKYDMSTARRSSCSTRMLHSHYWCCTVFL